MQAMGDASSSIAWPEPVGSARDSAAGELDTQPCAPEWPRAPREHLKRAEVTEWPVTFRAEAADYAPHWWRQAGRTVLTLGLYAPWAHRHNRRFFLQHTFVAGRRFDHEQPVATEVVRYGLWLSAALGVLAAEGGAPLAGALALSLVWLVWPLWLGVVHAQTVGALRWGRRPLVFHAPWWRVYRQMSPWVVLGLGLTWLAWWLHGPAAQHAWATPALALAGVMAVALAPLALWRWWACRQWHLGIGPLKLTWRGSVADVYLLVARVGLWGLALALVGASIHALAQGAWALLVQRGMPEGVQWALAMALSCAWGALVWPYAQGHAQNLVWQNTGCRYLRFRSRLNVMAYVALRARHSLWLLGTLGLAWPWVAVAARRMRLEAVTVVARVDPADLRAAWRDPALPRQAMH